MRLLKFWAIAINKNNALCCDWGSKVPLLFKYKGSAGAWLRGSEQPIRVRLTRERFDKITRSIWLVNLHGVSGLYLSNNADNIPMLFKTKADALDACSEDDIVEKRYLTIVEW